MSFINLQNESSHDVNPFLGRHQTRHKRALQALEDNLNDNDVIELKWKELVVVTVEMEKSRHRYGDSFDSNPAAVQHLLSIDNTIRSQSKYLLDNLRETQYFDTNERTPDIAMVKERKESHDDVEIDEMNSYTKMNGSEKDKIRFKRQVPDDAEFGNDNDLDQEALEELEKRVRHFVTCCLG